MDDTTSEIDRTKVCPLLLRCFWKLNRHHALSEYRNASNDILPAQEVQIHTWKDASLREITELMKDVVPPAREKNILLSYRLMFLDRNGQLQSKPIGRISPSKPSQDDYIKLQNVKFTIGDYIDIAIMPINSQSPRG